MRIRTLPVPAVSPVIQLPLSNQNIRDEPAPLNTANNVEDCELCNPTHG